MSKHEEIKLFETTMVRTFWEDEQEKWYFCINDVVGILTDSVDPADYFKTLRKRDAELDHFVRGSICPPPPIYFFRWEKTCFEMCGFKNDFPHYSVYPEQESRTN